MAGENINLRSFFANRRIDTDQTRAFIQAEKDRFDQLNRLTYMNGQGNKAANAIADINRVGTYHYFIICLDSEALSHEQREELLRERIQDGIRELKAPCRFEVVVQHRCIETWLLGNRKVYQRNPSGERFREYAAFYNVETRDPERMGCPPNSGFQLTAQFHEAYLRAMLAEKHIRYRKSRPGEVAKRYYFDELTRRITDEPTHLQSFGGLMALLGRIRQEM